MANLAPTSINVWAHTGARIMIVKQELEKARGGPVPMNGVIVEILNRAGVPERPQP